MNTYMCARLVMTVGLAISAFGAALVIFFGYPQPSFDRGIPIGADGPNVEEHNRGVEKKEYLYKFMSRLALVLIIIGFLIQIIAVWL